MWERRGLDGAGRPEHIKQAADVPIEDVAGREIDSAASKITVQGARYPEPLERMTGR
jgi:hypothetical protein